MQLLLQGRQALVNTEVPDVLCRHLRHRHTARWPGTRPVTVQHGYGELQPATHACRFCPPALHPQAAYFATSVPVSLGKGSVLLAADGST